METSASALFVANKIINELLDSSSSSDDDELIAVLAGRYFEPREKNFVESVINMYSKSEFKENLRVSRETAMYLVQRYSPSCYKRSYQGGKHQLTVETQILSFLWFCGKKTKFREVSTLFDMSLSTMHNSFNRILNFLATEIAAEVIKFPQTNHDKEAIAHEFEKLAGFPNVLGCVATTNIAVRSLKSASTTEGVSILFQGICDVRLRFLDVGTGEPNETLHDGCILKHSAIGNDLAKLCAPQYHLLGDSAYPLREYLLTPYRDADDGNLSEAEKNYNLKFRQTHMLANKALHVLKCRFRQLMRLEFHNVETMSQFIKSCCVLHNICIDRNDFHSEEMAFVSTTEYCHDNDGSGDNNLQHIQLGHLKRNETKEHLFNLTTI